MPAIYGTLIALVALATPAVAGTVSEDFVTIAVSNPATLILMAVGVGAAWYIGRRH